MPRVKHVVPQEGRLHAVSCLAYHRLPKLEVAKHRDLFCQLLEQLRVKFRFEIVGYVVLPASVQLLISPPEKETIVDVMAMLKQRYQRRYNTSARSSEPAWEKTITDLALSTPDQILGCLESMHQAPVKAALVAAPWEWEWSSARCYAGLPEGVVTVTPISDARALLSREIPAQA